MTDIPRNTFHLREYLLVEVKGSVIVAVTIELVIGKLIG